MATWACLLSVLAFVTVASLPQVAQAASLDKAHSGATFTITHLGFSRVTGKFQTIDSKIDVDGQGNIKNFSATARATTIDTGNSKRDDHLRSGDFFDVKNFPTVSLVMISNTANSLTADLTMRGKTERVRFTKRSGVVAGNRGDVFGMSLEATINRLNFGVGEGFLAKTLSEEVDVLLSFEFSL